MTPKIPAHPRIHHWRKKVETWGRRNRWEMIELKQILTTAPNSKEKTSWNPCPRFEMKSSQLPTSSQNPGPESNMKCKCSGIPWQKITAGRTAGSKNLMFHQFHPQVLLTRVVSTRSLLLCQRFQQSKASKGGSKRQEDTPARKHDCHAAEGSSKITEALVMTLERKGQSSVRHITKYALVSFENRIASKSFAVAVLRRHSILLFCRMTFPKYMLSSSDESRYYCTQRRSNCRNPRQNTSEKTSGQSLCPLE